MNARHRLILRWGDTVIYALSVGLLVVAIVALYGVVRASQVDHRTTVAAAESQRTGCAIQAIWQEVTPVTQYERDARSYYLTHPRNCVGVTATQTTPHGH